MLVIGTDIGTSSTKTVLVDSDDGRLLAWSRREYPMHRPHPGWAENDPDDWLAAATESIREVVARAGVRPAEVKALSIVAQRDPVVLLDEAGEVLAPGISWIDDRDRAECDAVYERFGRPRLIETTGLVPVPGLTLPNIHWIRRHRPEVWRRTRRLLSPKDYVLFRLTGRIATDISTPSRSMLYDLRRAAWSDWICREAGLDPALLPPIMHRPWEVWEELPRAAAERLGLAAGTILAAGGGDDPAAALGAGAVEPGAVAVGTGTASCWRVVAGAPTPDLTGRADISPHLVPDRYVYELIIAGTGSSLRWFRDTFGAPRDAADSYESLIAEAASVAPGADGLLFYPYLEGARAPRFNPDASGVFFGLRAGHRRGHLVRAIVEGIAFQYPPVMALVPEYGGRVGAALTVVDDECLSAFWNQIKADVTGIEIRTLAVRHAAAMGAAMLASVAAGAHRDPAAAAAAMIAVEGRHRPDLESGAHYARLRSRYERVLDGLEGAFHVAG